MSLADPYEDRHPSTQHMMKMLKPNPNLPTKLQVIAEEFEQLARDTIATLDDNPEVTAGLRKLLEAKDCFVRAAVFGTTVNYRDR